MQYIFESQTANASSTNSFGVSTGGKIPIVAWGTWDGATVALEFCPIGTTWISVLDSDGVAISLTADWAGYIDCPGRGKLRATIASVGTTSLNVGVNLT